MIAMEEKRLYIVHVDDIPENESFYDWSDEQVIEAAKKKKGFICKIEEFVERWNEGFAPCQNNTYIRLLDRQKGLIGYQPFEPNGEIPLHFPDWWVFRTKEEAELYLKWETFEDYTIEPVYDGDIDEPNLLTFDDYVFQWAVNTFDERKQTPENYEDILLFLRDNGVPKMRGHNIAERILNHFKQ